MSVTIAIEGHIAVVKNGKWRASDKGFAVIVRLYTEKRIGGYTPWSDYTLAQMAATALGGKIIKATNPPTYIAGRVY